MSKTEGVGGGNVWGYEPEFEPSHFVPAYPVYRTSDVIELIVHWVTFSAITFGLFKVSSLIPYPPAPPLETILMMVLVSIILIMVEFAMFFGLATSNTLANISKSLSLPLKITKEHNKRDFIGSSFIFAFFLGIAAILAGVLMNPHGNKADTFNEAYIQEYGYTEVDYPFSTDGETVQKANGEEVTVYVMLYKDNQVIFENTDQLNEKMKKVDAGTFLEGMNNE